MKKERKSTLLLQEICVLGKAARKFEEHGCASGVHDHATALASMHDLWYDRASSRACRTERNRMHTLTCIPMFFFDSSSFPILYFTLTLKISFLPLPLYSDYPLPCNLPTVMLASNSSFSTLSLLHNLLCHSSLSLSNHLSS